MSEKSELSLRPRWRRNVRVLAVLCVLATAVSAALAACGVPAVEFWAVLAVCLACTTAFCPVWLRRRLDADAAGLRFRSLWRWRRIEWDEIARLGVVEKDHGRGGRTRHVAAELRHGGRLVRLPLPYGTAPFDEIFDDELARLRALHRRHTDLPPAPEFPLFGAAPAEAPRARLVKARLLPLFLCVMATAGAGYVAVMGIAPEERQAREWRASVPCPATQGPADPRRDCRTTLHGVIERTAYKYNKRGEDDWLSFTGNRPTGRLNVRVETAKAFEPGDRVALTWWRGRLMTVASKEHTAEEDVPRPGSQAAVVTLALLGGSAFALLALAGRRRRGQPVAPGDRAEPTGMTFLLPIGLTALWAVPLAGLRPDAAVAVPVGAVCGLGTLALVIMAWRRTGPRGAPAPRALPRDEDVFLPARFLDDTPYNPHHLGTHIVVGKPPMAVLPHGGPGRFAAKDIPTQRLTVQGIRRPLPTEDVPSTWNVADLLDEGTHVRLAASPANLAVLVEELERSGRAARPEGVAP
ncbi:PH domain-containing protein [Streptomyces sp. NPDC059002]|uniref:PH domain-containing protein n=1 Tax=Streptomyces sp. NPDC059002 TaxID=3346690 RepID=UPI0036A44B0A